MVPLYLRKTLLWLSKLYNNEHACIRLQCAAQASEPNNMQMPTAVWRRHHVYVSNSWSDTTMHHVASQTN